MTYLELVEIFYTELESAFVTSIVKGNFSSIADGIMVSEENRFYWYDYNRLGVYFLCEGGYAHFYVAGECVSTRFISNCEDDNVAVSVAKRIGKSEIKSKGVLLGLGNYVTYKLGTRTIKGIVYYKFTVSSHVCFYTRGLDGSILLL